MFTGQLIGYVGADARANKNGKGFYFHVSSKFKGTGDSEDKTLWISCFVNFDTKSWITSRKGHKCTSPETSSSIYSRERTVPAFLR